MKRKIIIIISVIAIYTILLTTGIVIYKELSKPKIVNYDISHRIDSESIYIDSEADLTQFKIHLFKSFEEYNSMLLNIGTNGSIPKSSFDKHDYISYVSTSGPCSGKEYPAAMETTANKIIIKIAVDDWNGACADNTIHFIPIKKGAFNTLPTVNIISAYNGMHLY